MRFVIGSDSEPSNPRVIVHELPCVFVEREVSETRRRRPSVAMEIVKVTQGGYTSLTEIFLPLYAWECFSH